MNLLFSIVLPSSNFAIMAVLFKPRRVETEDYYYDALAFSR